MNERIESILNYIKINGSLDGEFGNYAKVYPNTSENIKDFINCFDLTDKKVLSVAASGDQMLNCILKGCRNITLFDVNLLTLYQVKLKKAAVINLDFCEYMDFFNISNYIHGISDPKVFDHNLFKKLLCSLDDETVTFFEELYKYYETDKKLYNKIYFGFNSGLTHMNNMNNYMSIENYDKLKNILEKDDIDLSFIESNIIDLTSKLNDKYDLMLFSNISDYISKMYKTNPLVNYYELINNLQEFLNDDGVMQVGYIYNHFNTMTVPPSDFVIDKIREEVFPKDVYRTINVNAFEDSEPFQYYDKVITYQKTK